MVDRNQVGQMTTSPRGKRGVVFPISFVLSVVQMISYDAALCAWNIIRHWGTCGRALVCSDGNSVSFVMKFVCLAL